MNKCSHKAKELRDMRKRAGLSQWSVAQAVGKTQGWLSIIELGYHEPSEADLISIEAAIRNLQAAEHCRITA